MSDHQTSGLEDDVTTADAEWKEAIDQEHLALRGVLARMEATTDLHRLLPLVEELRPMLEEHFLHEESPKGLYDVMESLAPSQVASLQNILAEHREFLDRLDGLKAKIRQCMEGPVAEVLRDVKALAESLHDHEARESALFTDAVFTDLGSSG